MPDELWRMSAVEAVARLRKREISPLELVEASARRIGEVEPAVNALPTVCLDRARDHAQHETIDRVRPRPCENHSAGHLRARLIQTGCHSRIKDS